MRLGELLEPLDLETFRSERFGQRAFVLERHDNRFEKLLDLQTLEARLNDGCASLVNLHVIGKDSRKLPRETVYAPQRAGAWSREFLLKSEVRRALEAGASLVMHNLSQVTPGVAELTASIEDAFPGHQCDLHVYLSPRAGASGYAVHQDSPQHKLYLQAYGTTRWTVYRGRHEARSMSFDQAARFLEVDFEVTVTPGTLIYLPPGVFHHAESLTSRVSLSFPFHEAPRTKQVDRSHVPLMNYFK